MLGLIEVRDSPAGGHLYRRGGGLWLPGATTVIDRTVPSPSLDRWRARQYAAAGVARGAASGAGHDDQIGEADAAVVDADRLQRHAADEGAARHARIAAVCDAWTFGRPAPDDTPDDGVAALAAAAVLERLDLLSWTVEAPVIDEPAGYGGTIDLIGHDAAGRVHVVDWKTTDRCDWLAEAHLREAVQVAAYAAAAGADAAHIARVGALGQVALTTVDLAVLEPVWEAALALWRSLGVRRSRWQQRTWRT